MLLRLLLDCWATFHSNIFFPLKWPCVFMKVRIVSERGIFKVCKSSTWRPVVDNIKTSVYDWLFLALSALFLVGMLHLLSNMFHRSGDNKCFTHPVISDWNTITSRSPTANTLVTHSARTIPETLFYSKILLRADALISCFPSGIQAKKEGESCWRKWKMKYNTLQSCNESRVKTSFKPFNLYNI